MRCTLLAVFLASGAMAGAESVVSTRPGNRTASTGRSPRADRPVLRMQADPSRAWVPTLSWDTEGGSRAETNLLRKESGIVVRWQMGEQWYSSRDTDAKPEGGAGEGTSYRLPVAPDATLIWSIVAGDDHLTLKLLTQGKPAIERLEIVFPFDPKVTPTTVFPARWEDDGSLRLPGIISAPDFGLMYLSCSERPVLQARLEGSRAHKTVNLIVELPLLGEGKACTLQMNPSLLPLPRGLQDLGCWRAARRGWFNIFQPTAQWGDQGNPFSSPPGMLGNNVVSDPASPSLWFYADQAFWTPVITPDISLMPLVRRTIDFWLDKRTRPTGEVVGYWAYGDFLDANAGPLIASWDYVEVTGDLNWLRQRIDRLEFIADFLARRDVDGDGIIEATQSGNRGTLKQPARSCAWWDALNCGHKDGYTNAIIYRAFRCLADLEAKLDRPEKASRYHDLADRLKKAYVPTLLNSQTGWLAWWRSADGERHDYATPIVNGLAIEYGLVPPDQGREILTRLHEKIRAVGFTRFDLGVPPMLIPVLRSDYLLPDAIGCPKREDGTDTFGRYMNGGITAGQVLHFLMAHYVVGRTEQADAILEAMLARQQRGEFQNGVQDAADKGIDWTTWDGRPCGYEGYLADSFRFLQAVVLREPACRERFYRPLTRPER